MLRKKLKLICRLAHFWGPTRFNHDLPRVKQRVVNGTLTPSEDSRYMRSCRICGARQVRRMTMFGVPYWQNEGAYLLHKEILDELR